jgi:hypothetical protein
MKYRFKSTAAALLLVGAFGATGQAQAGSILIDGFGDDATTGTVVTDASGAGPSNGSTSNSAEALSDTNLTDAERTITAESIGSFTSMNVASNPGPGAEVLRISNDSGSNGLASLYYTFQNEDFTAQGGSAIIFDVLNIDTILSVNMTINGTSTSGFTAFSNPGQFFRLFSAFSNPGVFSAVTDIRLDFKGNQEWDAQFDNLRVDVPTNAPEPATLALMGLGLAGFAASRKKKQA